MLCKQCNGSGKRYNPGYGEEDCSLCNGTGEMPITNDEWRKTCSTEEFTEWITNTFCPCDNHPRLKEAVKRDWMKWLEQPHREVAK